MDLYVKIIEREGMYFVRGFVVWKNLSRGQSYSLNGQHYYLLIENVEIEMNNHIICLCEYLQNGYYNVYACLRSLDNFEIYVAKNEKSAKKILKKLNNNYSSYSIEQFIHAYH